MNSRKVAVILHGWNLEGKTFKPLQAIFEKKGYVCYCPDLPGFGGTEIKRPYSVSDYVSFLKDYIKEKKIDNFSLFCHSFGGRVGIKFVSRYPENVEMLVLTGVPGFVPVRKHRIILFMVLSKTGGFIFRLPFLSRFRDFARNFLYRAARSRDYLKTGGFLRETFLKVIREDLAEDMSTISVKTYLIWGSEDKTVPLRIARKMEKTIKGSRLEIVYGENHRLPYKSPSKFFSAFSMMAGQV